MTAERDDTHPPVTLGRLVRQARDRLAAGGIDTAALDARLLVTAAAGLDPSRAVLEPDLAIEAGAVANATGFIGRRLGGEPVGRILGRREFWGLELALSRETLEPRADTERLVEAVLAWCDETGGRQRALRFADIGTGSGAIAIALLSELPQALALAVDIAPGALATARGNALRCGVGERFLAARADLAAAIAPGCDFLVSNPPYISTREAAGLSTEVAGHDPALALFAGPEGLDAYAAMLPQGRRVLGRFAPFFMEIGAAQAEAVSRLARDVGFEDIEVFQDLGGRDRVVRARCVAK